MFNISPVISFPLFCVHLLLSVIALCLCLVSFVAIIRTKKTPYPTKLFSLGLLIYDCLFIISAFAGKFYAHEENFVFVQLARDFKWLRSLSFFLCRLSACSFSTGRTHFSELEPEEGLGKCVSLSSFSAFYNISSFK